MPDLGAPSTLPSLPSSHTSTQQWQSFEIRMRHRRAERCVIRAEVALEAGFEEDARAALDEARRLNSGSPDLETVRATVTARLASSAADRRAQLRRRAMNLAAAALLVFATGATAFWTWDGESPAAQTAAAPAPPAEAPPAAAATNTAVATAGDAAVTPKEAAAEAPQKSAAPVTEEASVSEKERDAASPPAEPAVAERKPAAPPVADRTPPAAPEPAPRIETPSPALAAPPSAGTIAAASPPVESIERLVESLPVASVGSVPRRDERAGADEPPAAVEEPRVRAALARYESAYSGLNASAAQAVWPGVDERSLARAFDTLESQRVSLGRCAVQVHDTTARANCSGSVTFTPKVGGGTQTQPRQWSFELAQANGAWQITRAEAK